MFSRMRRTDTIHPGYPLVSVSLESGDVIAPSHL
jgi:hypothetical protein